MSPVNKYEMINVICRLSLMEQLCTATFVQTVVMRKRAVSVCAGQAYRRQMHKERCPFHCEIIDFCGYQQRY